MPRQRCVRAHAPVFGPLSALTTRVKSCAGSSGTAATPSVTTKSDPWDGQYPRRRPAALGRVRQRRGAVIGTPSQCGREPVVFHHVGGESSSARAALAASAQGSAGVCPRRRSSRPSRHVWDPSAGRPRRTARDGDALARTASAAHATSGASGQTTTSRPGAPRPTPQKPQDQRIDDRTSAARQCGIPRAATSASTAGSPLRRGRAHAPPPHQPEVRGPESYRPLLTRVDQEVCVRIAGI